MLGQAEDGVQYTLHGAMILIIDDDSATRTTLSAYLEQSGLRTMIARNAATGLKQARRRPPDLIVLNMHMQDLDAGEDCRRLNADASTSDIPMIVLAPATEVGAIVTALRAGVVDYITTPLQCEAVLSRVSTHLRAQKMARDLRNQQAANTALASQIEDRTAALTQAHLALQEQIQALQRAEEALAAERNILRVLVEHLPERIAVKNTEGQFVLVNTAMLQSLGAFAPEQLDGKINADTQPSKLAAHLDADEQAILHSGQPLFNHEETLVDDQTGTTSWVVTTKVPVRDAQSKIIGLVSMGRDITRRKRAEQHLALQFAVTRIVSDAESRQATVPKLLEVICTGIGWTLGELWRVDSLTNRLHWESAWHTPSLQAAEFVAASREVTFPPGVGLPGQVWASGQPLRLADVSSDGAMPQLPLAASLGLHHCGAFPIRGSNGVLGVILFWSRVAIPDDADLLTTFADLGRQIGLFFERVQADERLRQYVRRVVDAQEAEREHIARELHDEIGVALALIKMNVRAVQRLAHESDLVPRLEQSLGIIEETLQRVRTMALDLRPSLLDDLGLVTTLRWYVDRHAQWAGLAAEVIVEDFDSRIPPQLETVCFRVAQEALSNIARHAHAHNVHIKLWQRERAVYMLIRDDGVGFDVLSAQERGADGVSIGLLGMEDRVILAGGQLVIESAHGRGTTVWLRLPLAKSASAGTPATQGAAS